ncbi:hypothetical protein AC630_40075 [Bradyrhizobium sp. AS23.2]|nr:hypothetical protein AC630_40075 [Bradyrhizobium sp. AS23.2]
MLFIRRCAAGVTQRLIRRAVMRDQFPLIVYLVLDVGTHGWPVLLIDYLPQPAEPLVDRALELDQRVAESGARLRNRCRRFCL